MSDLWFNVSVGRVHLQIGRDWPWVRIGWNANVTVRPLELRVHQAPWRR